MKRIASFFLILCLLLGMLASCGGKKEPTDPNPPAGEPSGQPQDPGKIPGGGTANVKPSIPAGLTGEDVLKLLLADARLSGKMLHSGDSIFAKGADTMRTLAARAEENRDVQRLTASIGTQAATLGTVLLSASGKEITDFDAISRNYAEFESTTDSIVSSAQKAEQMIDYVKMHVRILDTWIITPGYGELFLHVDENSEWIFNRDTSGAFMCCRYLNAQGDDVYEVWEQSSFANLRFLYVAGKQYEMFYEMDDGGRYQGISASNDKGYWEIFDCIYDSAWMESQFDPRFVILKDDVCYQASYSFREDASVTYKITSPDKSCDILTVNESADSTMFEINLGAFSGYYGVVEIMEGNVGKLKLSDGSLISHEIGELSLASGNSAFINAVYATESAFGTEGSVMISISGSSAQARRADLLSLLQAWGITSEYDLSNIFTLVDLASEEFEAMRSYLRWHGHAVDTEAAVRKGIEAEAALFASYTEEYNKVKDLAKVEMGSDAAALLVQFAPITASTVRTVAASGASVTIESISLAVEDTLLFIKNANYRLAFALRAADGALVHLSSEAPLVAYSGGDSFSVSAENVSLSLPILSVGEYELVSYIAMEDGIRACAPAVIAIESVSGEGWKERNIKGEVVIAGDASKVVYTETADAVAVIYAPAETTYAAFYAMVAEIAFSYGVPSDQLIERVDPETMEAVSLTGEETAIEEGRYRIGFSVTNGEKVTEGYVYLEFVHASEIADEADLATE